MQRFDSSLSNVFVRSLLASAGSLAACLGAASAQAADLIDVTKFVVPSKSPTTAPCNGTSDDTDYIHDALAAAIAAKSGLYFPAGAKCRTSQTLSLTKLITLKGDGPGVSHLIYTGNTNNNFIEVIPPVRSGGCPAPGAPGTGSIAENIGHTITGLDITPEVEDSGSGNAIWVYLQCGAPYAYFDYSNLRIGPFGGLGLLLDNSVANENGFFNGRVSNSLIFNGINVINMGDSVTFEKVTASGSHNVSLSGLGGARQSAWIGGQISTKNGALALTGVHGFRARDVWIEEQSACTSGCTTAAISVVDSWDAVFEGLTFNVKDNTALTTAIALYGARDTKIINNNFVNRGTSYHIYGAASGLGATKRTRVEGNNYYLEADSQPYPAVVTFQSGSN